MLPIYYALAANITFALAIIIYTSFSHRTSVLWTNSIKAVVATLAFALSVSLFLGWSSIEWHSLSWLIFSGALGLAVGDMFLLRAFTLIGPARTMVLFAFQPLFMGFMAFILFSQEMPVQRLAAVLCLVGCLIIFSYERYRTNKDWGMLGITYALIGVLLDGVGILMTRYAFDESPQIHTFEGNFYRCFGALAAFAFINYTYKPIHLFRHFASLDGKTKIVILFASLLGTFVSLGFYLEAVKFGHLASVSAIAITGPIFTALFESLWEKKVPSAYFFAAFALFLAGFYFLNV